MFRMVISYQYSGGYGRIASGAEARIEETDELLGRARLLEIRKEGTLVVEETQYGPTGSQVYSGRVLFPPSGGKRDESISGSKRLEIFRDWPS